MFSTRNVLIAAAILAAAPAPALLAQQGAGGSPQGGHEQHERGEGREGRGGPGQRGGRGMGSPVQRLIEHGQDLNLSSQQVARLQQIDQALQAQTQPLRQQLEQYRPAGGQDGRWQDGQGQRAEPSQADREAMRARMEQARPVMEQLRKANDSAMQRAFQVLSADQRKQAESLMPRRGEGREGREGGRRGGQGGNGQGGWNRSGGSR
ncbi:MAG TPA: hypothetical protein VFH27_07905 [Longimicrobiaceae bacterium]|nr:hypothetical protein [Longimicrobiaceae bacterium]